MESKTAGQVQLVAAVTPRMRAADVARALGVTDQAVSAWVRGVARPDPDQMARLEELLGIPMRAWTETVDSADDTGPRAARHVDSTGS